MDLANLFSEKLLQRFNDLDEKLDTSDFQTDGDIEMKNLLQGKPFSEEVNEFYEIQNKITQILLAEAIENVELGEGYDAHLEVKPQLVLPFEIMIVGREGKCMRGKPFGRYFPEEDPDEYIDREIEEIKKMKDLLN